MRLATAAYRVRHPSAEVGGSLKTYRFAFITRGDPSKLLGIAALPVLTYFHVRSGPVLANPAHFRRLTARV